MVWTATLLAASIVASVPGVAPRVRDAFALRLEASGPGSMAAAAEYFAVNMRVTTALLLAAWIRARCRTVRAGCDVIVLAAVVLNAALVGAAIGAYGIALAPSLAHLPFEWAALGVAADLYVNSRSAGIHRREWLASATATTALFALAAFVESFATP